MTIPVGTILRVVAVLQWADGNIMQNVFNAVIAGTGGPYDEDDIVKDALTWVEAMYANLVSGMSASVDGSEIRVYEYDPPDDDWDEVGADAWIFSPTASGDYMPLGVAGLINAKSLDPDVSAKKYLGGLTESHGANGLLEAGQVTRYVDFAADWVTAFVGSDSAADWVPVVWSPTKLTPYFFTGTVIIPTIPAYQRRRKQGVGI
jgi:hypothetical protein